MSSGLLGTIENWQTRLTQERVARTILVEQNAPPVIDLRFRKQSHNAVVFQGELGRNPVFLKQYLTSGGARTVRKCVEETTLVRGQMDGVKAGIADILWASQDCAMVLMSAAPGTPVADALTDGKVAQVMPQVAHWLKQYIGPRFFLDTFSPSYWIKVRAAQDISGLSTMDRALFVKCLDLQRARHAEHGSMHAVKGQYPNDFAPHNLHWADDAVWGFDIEGHAKGPIARSIATFFVLAERRLPEDSARHFGVNATCFGAFLNEIDLSSDAPALMAFVILDEMMKSLIKRHDDPVAGAATRRLLHAHLADG